MTIENSAHVRYDPEEAVRTPCTKYQESVFRCLWRSHAKCLDRHETENAGLELIFQG